MCEWNTGLVETAMAEALSHQKIGTWERKIHNSLKRICSQDIFAAVVAKARYSAFVEERATVVCFLDDQEMGEGPRNTRRPVVER